MLALDDIGAEETLQVLFFWNFLCKRNIILLYIYGETLQSAEFYQIYSLLMQWINLGSISI
jgi:hypothetical protein